MLKQKPSENDMTQLELRLRGDAAAERPEFSPRLHARIMRTLAVSRAKESAGTATHHGAAPRSGVRRPIELFRALGITAAAACLLVATLVIVWSSNRNVATRGQGGGAAAAIVTSGQTGAPMATAAGLADDTLSQLYTLAELNFGEIDLAKASFVMLSPDDTHAGVAPTEDVPKGVNAPAVRQENDDAVLFERTIEQSLESWQHVKHDARVLLSMVTEPLPLEDGEEP